MLVVKLDVEKNKENYYDVIERLKDLDIVSVAWEDEVKATGGARSGKSDPTDLASTLSAAVNSLRNRQSGY